MDVHLPLCEPRTGRVGEPGRWMDVYLPLCEPRAGRVG